MLCEEVLTSTCANGHAQTFKCHQKQPLACWICERDAKRAAEKLQKDFALQKKRDAEQQAHDEKMANIREKLDAQIQAQKDFLLVKEREAALKQQEQDVKDAEERLRQKAEADKKRKDDEVKRTAEQAAASSSSIAASVINTFKSAVNTLTGTPPKQPSLDTNSGKGETEKQKPSEAQSDWQRRKDTDGVVNPHIDAIMEMIGLEPVKQQVLKIMDKVDVNVRQGTSLSKERFNVVLLGNPGTGIARSVARNAIAANPTSQERLPWRGTMPNSWLPWMFFLVISSWKPPGQNSETRESLVLRRWSRIHSRPAEAASSSTRHINSPPNTITVVARSWTTCWRRWRTISESWYSFSLGIASRWRSSSNTTLASRVVSLINSTSRTTKTASFFSCSNNRSRRSGTSV